MLRSKLEYQRSVATSATNEAMKTYEIVCVVTVVGLVYSPFLVNLCLNVIFQCLIVNKVSSEIR